MKPITNEWIEKAEGDWVSAQREARARKLPNYDLACFATQQCAEKYLKARLVESGIHVKKTHDLEALLKLVVPIEPSWGGLLPDLKNLSDFAVKFRYPGASATKSDASGAIKSCRNVRKVIRTAFKLPI